MSSEASADLVLLADRLLSDEKAPLADRLPLAVLVSADVPAVVPVAFVPEPPLLALRLSAVVPVEAE